MSLKHAPAQDITHLELELSPEENFESAIITTTENMIEDADEGATDTEIESSKIQTERRHKPRTRPQPKGLRGFIRRIINKLVKQLDSGWKGWLPLGAIITISLIIIWWSMIFRMHMLDASYNLASEHNKQLEKFAQLMEQWSHIEITSLQERVSSAESRVFHDYTRLANWLSLQAKSAGELQLTMHYTMHPAQASRINNVREIPIDIRINAQQNNTHVYLAMLEFIKTMIDDQWHLEIHNALIQSDDIGANNMVISIYVWVHDPNHFSNTGTSTNEEPAE